MKPRNIYSERIPVKLVCEGVGMTRQEFKESTDVNNILKKYVKTGILPVCQQKPIYGDYTDVPTYQEAIDTVLLAEEQFNALPSELRKKLDHDPAKFLDWVEKATDESLIKYGLKEKGLTFDVEPDTETVEEVVQPPPESS